MAYIGKSPDGTGVRSRFYYTQTSGGGTSVSGSSDDGTSLAFSDGAYVDVFLNGVLLVAGTDYNTSTANTIAGLAALANGDVVEVVVYDIFTVADTVSASAGGTFSANVAVTGDLTVDTSTLKVDSSNNRVGIGTSSPSSIFHTEESTTGASIVRHKNTSNTSGAHSRLIIQNGGSSGGDAIINLDAQASGSQFTLGVDRTANKFIIANADKGSFDGSNEAMAIDSSGNLLIGTTTSSTAHDPGVVITSNVQPGLFINNSTTSSGVSLILLRASHSTADETKFEVTAAGNVKSRTNSYGSFSDERLKEQIADAPSQWDDIKAIKVKNFKFISELDDADNPKMIGVVAQQVESVSPALVEDDADGMKTVKYSILYMKAVKALQEAMTRIETLETKVAALEAAE